MLGFASMSGPAIKYRLDQACDFFAALLTHQLAARSTGAAVRWLGCILRTTNGTCIREPGSKTIDWRVQRLLASGTDRRARRRGDRP